MSECMNCDNEGKHEAYPDYDGLKGDLLCDDCLTEAKGIAEIEQENHIHQNVDAHTIYHLREQLADKDKRIAELEKDLEEANEYVVLHRLRVGDTGMSLESED